MFRFLEISLHGWDHWQQVRVPLDRDVILLSGPNGSGKTTFLDAIRQLLGSPKLSSKRRLQHYLKNGHQPSLIRAVVSNKAQEARAAPFFKERITTDEVTLACALVPSTGGSPEKRFCIAPGRPSVAELQTRLLEGKDGRDYFGPELYERKLQHAGISRSLLSVLQIEQGKTHALFERTPRELFRQVLDMLGDKAVLDRYGDARRRYGDANQELARQAQALIHKQTELSALHRKVQERQGWEDAEARVQELEGRLPAARYQVSFKEAAELGAKQQELRTKVRNGDAQGVVLAQAVAQAEQAALSGQKSLNDSTCDEEQKLQDWNDASIASALADERVEALRAKERRLVSMPARDLPDLEARQVALHKASAEKAIERDARKSELATLEARIQRLRAGLPAYPEQVRNTLDALEQAGIPHRMLCGDVLDVEPSVARAVEAALGDTRFALLVGDDAHAGTFEIAKRTSFPGPVYSGPSSATRTTAGPAQLAAGAPCWLEGLLSAVSFGTDGTFSDERGSWTGTDEGRFLGAGAIQEELGTASDALPAARERVTRAEEHLEVALSEVSSAGAVLEEERERRRLLSEAAGLPEACASATDLKRALAAAAEAKDAASAVRRRTSELFSNAKSALAATANDLSMHERQLAGEREALQSADGRWGVLEEELRRLRDAIGSELRTTAEAGRLSGPDTVEADLRIAQRRLGELPAPPPPEVRLEAKHLTKNVEELESHVRQRKADADAAEKELSECRRRYLEIINFTLAEYKRRAVELGRSADVEVVVELPVLRDDERCLDEATITPAFGFDGKDVAPMGDSSFSGGQQVVAGLILLMAMAETEGHGFFMLDEPFAHLSVDRVEEVGRFLRGSRAQFLITAPTSLDRAQLDPASMVIVLQKKKRDAQYAPAPVVAIA